MSDVGISYVGIVNRKDKDTGVTLRAKIVTPSKKKSVTHNFKVRVKRSGLSDYERCVMDQAEVREKLTTQYNLGAVSEDLSFISQGTYGCTITYTIEDVSMPFLSNYLDPSGSLKARPRLGEADSTGYVTIKVSYGKESIETRLTVTIAQYDAESILESEIFNEKILWDSIRGKNENYELRGYESIQHPLNLIADSSKISSAAFRKDYGTMAATPVTFTWSVEDQIRNSVITQDRITISGTTGSVFRPAYKDAMSIVDTDTANEINVISLGTDRSVQMKGLILKCTLELNGGSKTIELLCGTRSKFLTNAEVLEALIPMLTIEKQGGGSFTYADKVADAANNTISVDINGSKLGLPFAETGKTWTIPDLGLSTGEVMFYTESRICEFNNVANTYDNTGSGNMLNMVDFNPNNANFPINTTDFNESRVSLEVDGAKLSGLANETLKKFTVSTVLKVLNYSKDGELVSGSAPGTTSSNLYTSFTLKPV